MFLFLFERFKGAGSLMKTLEKGLRHKKFYLMSEVTENANNRKRRNSF